MSKDVIIVAGATHREGFLDEYEKSLADAGIDFYLHELPVLSLGANSISMSMRIAYFREMAQKFIDYETIFITDAWDVMFFGTKEELIAKAPKTFLCSAERNCYPEAHLADMIESRSKWRYANNGMVAGDPQYILNWCSAAELTPDMYILDQGWFNRRLAEKSPLVQLDTTTKLFYVVSAWLEDGALEARKGRPYNAAWGTYPNFLHFSGKCPSDGVRKMLEESR